MGDAVTIIRVLRDASTYPKYDYEVRTAEGYQGRFVAQGNNKDYVFINKAGNIVFYEGTLRAYRAANSEQLLETFLKIVTDGALPTPEDIARQLAIQEEQREAEALRNLQEDEVEREAYQLLLEIYDTVLLPGGILKKINRLVNMYRGGSDKDRHD